MSDEDISFLGASSGAEDGEMDWEEVDISPAEPVSVNLAPGPVISNKTIEITLPSEKSKGKEKAGPPRVKVMSQAERVARLNSHKIHTVALLASTAIRNRWANDKLLHARLMSLTPLALQHGFSMIHKKLQPDASKRGRLFEAAMSRLCEWWYESFDVYPDAGIKSRTYDQVAAGALDGEEGEVVRSEKSLMKHALQRSGSRDISAQLFTALCRSLGIPARLVFSVQSVPWQASVGKPKPKPKKSTPSTPVLGDDSDMEEVPIPGPSKPKAQPAVKLRKRKPPEIRPPLAGWPPVFWTEVFSRPDGRWIPVDPVRNLVNKKRLFEPPKNDPNNRMTYVVAFEEDGYVRDVTRRYARASTKLLRGGRAHKEWWDNVLAPLTRPYRLNRDDVEDDELQYQTVIEGMPTSVAAFKDHPLYVLERHLRRDEVIHPRTEVGRFRGDPVFSRSAVISLKTAENWMRQGRTLVEGAQPLKRVPMRAVTINRRREVEAAAAEGEETLQGLYSYAQTKVYVPPPIVDGKVPKNDFGNLDLYVPSMLPAGAVHIPHKGTAKIARQLGFDFAEAVTGFEFKKRRATPIVTGVVVATENEEALLEAYWASVADSEEKERAKRRERVLKRWSRLVHGLRIRERLQKEYATTSNGVAVDVEVCHLH
ncbi:Rad4-domain-containing protein [Exidia glandulosa HHB12029]|uniref:Rad4-domain-containing protein n=1 Tax=Exidia glandulosa HHB12029 TaxID=1314781 RepID=A0A166AIM9_EXIGL|nr:Rad4-domain-containing protein [Exidia glandulosa HHB12029]